MKREISQPLLIAVIVIVVVAAGVFGWLRLRTPTPSVTADETQAARQNQMNTMKNAMMQMRSQQGAR